MVFLVSMLLVPYVIFAAGGESMPWDSGLEKVANALSGPTAKVVGVILFIGGGIALGYTEGQATKRVFWVVIGIGVALNAASIVSMIYGDASGLLISRIS